MFSHESTDVSALSIMWTAIFFVISGVAIVLVFIWAFFFLKSFIEANNVKTAPENIISLREGPPPPLLEVDFRSIKKAYLEKEKQMLDSYQWIDKEKGIVRIPVDKAIEILLYEYR